MATVGTRNNGQVRPPRPAHGHAVAPHPARRPAPAQSQYPGNRARALWSALSPDLAEKFRPYVPGMARALVDEIQRAVPEYAKPLDGPVGEVLVKGVKESILHCLKNIVDPSVPETHWREVFHQIGEMEFKAGRSLDCLQTAYRVGGRVSWRYIAEFGQKFHSTPESLYLTAEAIFAYIDELSALSIEGYTVAQARASGTLARRRRRLLEMILAGPTAGMDAISALATSANWAPPEWIAMVAFEPRSDQHELATPAAAEQVLMDFESTEPCMLLTDPETQIAELETNLNGWHATIGPTVRLADAQRSLQLARRCTGLVQRGVIEQANLTRCADHLGTLWLLTDEFLVAELRKRSLQPLCELSVKQRARLGETLLVWLQSRDSAPELARKLNVHPQTIRYRMHQIEELFGERLRNPDDRLELEIALRAERLTGKD